MSTTQVQSRLPYEVRFGSGPVYAWEIVDSNSNVVAVFPDRNDANNVARAMLEERTVWHDAVIARLGELDIDAIRALYFLLRSKSIDT